VSDKARDFDPCMHNQENFYLIPSFPNLMNRYCYLHCFSLPDHYGQFSPDQNHKFLKSSLHSAVYSLASNLGELQMTSEGT